MRTKSFLLWLFLFVAAFALLILFAPRIHAQVPTPITPPGYNDPLVKPLASLVGVNSSAVTMWASRLFYFGVVMKIFAGRIATWLSAKLAWQVEQKNGDADALILGVLGSKLYRGVAVLLDWAFSVELPTVASYQKQLDVQKTPLAPSTLK